MPFIFEKSVSINFQRVLQNLLVNLESLLKEKLSKCEEPALQDEHCLERVPQPPARDPDRFFSAHMSVPNVNPPEVQHIVVEHIVKSKEASSHMHEPFKLRFFSGRFPHPVNEMDYET